MNWLTDYASVAAYTDQFAAVDEHVNLLATGLAGESGSVLSELKKQRREHQVFLSRRSQMCEEMGDFLWYYIRLVQVLAPELMSELSVPDVLRRNDAQPATKPFLEFGSAAANILAAIAVEDREGIKAALQRTWASLISVSIETGISIREAAETNRVKIQGRWPIRRSYLRLFDEGFPEEEQLPRMLDVEFRERITNGRPTVVLRCNGLNLGDRLTDNIRDPDGYRFHDVFHFAHMVHLGWSPIARGFFRCKRKSLPGVDEAEDGARAAIVEEAISVIVFGRAKQLSFFERASRVDYDLLKTVRGLVVGYEVDEVPMWQWEAAILDGYRVFRDLRRNGGGILRVDIGSRSLHYERPSLDQKALGE
jgi:NTP pyrophosphatase (non-canonical NTP hydrolase)